MIRDMQHKGPVVTMAGTGINLALGVLYTWSIFKGAIKESIEQGGGFKWDPASLNDPYAVCCLVFAFTMILAGKCQDRFGPRITAMIGGILVGIGFIWIGQTTAYWSWVFGFGLLVGTGIAFGYSSATPASMKWFPPNRTGMIAGIVVSGFGLASVYIAPLAQYLLESYGLRTSMLFFGIAFMAVVLFLAFFLVNPPEGYIPRGFVDRRINREKRRELRTVFDDREFAPEEVIRTPSFWLLWILYFIGAGAGLMVIGSVAGMAKRTLGADAFLAVALLAVGNASGRLVAGFLSDKIGRKKALMGMFVFQALLMFVAIPVTTGAGADNAVLLVLLATLIGFNYGSNLAIFPSFTKDMWGFKHFGVNYGILFSAWGVGGFVMSRVSQSFAAVTGTFNSSFITAGILLIAGAGLICFIKDEKWEMRKKINEQAASAGRPE